MLGVCGQYNRIFSRRIDMKIEFSSQRREMLLFFTTNMADVTSCANQQYSSHLFEVHWVHFCWLKHIEKDLNDVVGSKWALLHKVKFYSQLAKRFKYNKSTSFNKRIWLLCFCLCLLCWLIGRTTCFSRVKNIVHSSDWLKLVTQG